MLFCIFGWVGRIMFDFDFVGVVCFLEGIGCVDVFLSCFGSCLNKGYGMLELLL